MTFEWKHPKYWAELRAEKRKLQAASLKQAIQETVPQCDIEEASRESVRQTKERKALDIKKKV
jgi:hypothetical protein